MAPGRARSWSRKSTRDGNYYEQPSSPDRCGGTLFFAADDGIHGRELWKSDGTRAGTVLVKDIDPPTTAAAPPP